MYVRTRTEHPACDSGFGHDSITPTQQLSGNMRSINKLFESFGVPLIVTELVCVYMNGSHYSQTCDYLQLRSSNFTAPEKLNPKTLPSFYG